MTPFTILWALKRLKYNCVGVFDSDAASKGCCVADGESAFIHHTQTHTHTHTFQSVTLTLWKLSIRWESDMTKVTHHTHTALLIHNTSRGFNLILVVLTTYKRAKWCVFNVVSRQHVSNLCIVVQLVLRLETRRPLHQSSALSYTTRQRRATCAIKHVFETQ